MRGLAQRDMDPSEQYFGNRGPLSGSTPETSWMNSIQPNQQGGQGGGETSYQSQQMIQPGFIGAGGATQRRPGLLGLSGARPRLFPGSMGDVSGFNGPKSGAGGTGGLTPGDFATFSKALNNPTALQDWLGKGGIYGRSGGNNAATTLNPFSAANTFGYGGLGHSIGATLGWGASPSGGASLGGSALGNTTGPGVGDGGW